MSRTSIVTAAAGMLAVSALAAPAFGVAPEAGTALGAQGAAASAPAGSARYSDPEWLPIREETAVHCTTVMRHGGCAPSGHPAIYLVPRHQGDGPSGAIDDPIYAAGYGIAHIGAKGYTCSGGGRNPARGNWVWIDHGKRQATLYFHLARVMVREGQQVTPNTLLGPMGRTGKCKGTYLHFERRIGKVDGRPEKALQPLGKACHGSQLVRYPKLLGARTWAQVPYNSIIWSDGTNCG